MTEKDVIYYCLWGKVIAKRVKNNGYSDNYLFKSGKWSRDVEHVITDHLTGGAPSEPEGSPYRNGSTGVLMEMEEISEEEAISSINQQILTILKEEWKTKFRKQKEEWDKEPGWPSKLVKTTFTLNGRKYTIKPEDIGLTSTGWDQGFMESIQGEIKKDLEEYGAAEIYNLGFID